MRKAQLSPVPLFEERGASRSASRDSRPTVAEARRRMKSWGSQLVVADKLERDRPLFARRPRNESELLDCDDAIFLTSLDAAASAPLHMNEFWRLWIIKINLNNPQLE